MTVCSAVPTDWKAERDQIRQSKISTQFQGCCCILCTKNSFKYCSSMQFCYKKTENKKNYFCFFRCLRLQFGRKSENLRPSVDDCSRFVRLRHRNNGGLLAQSPVDTNLCHYL